MAYKYDYITFNEVFEDAEDFYSAYPAAYAPYGALTQTELTFIYVLLKSKYGTAKTYNSSERFVERTMATVFQFGPKMIKDLEIQTRLRNLQESEMLSGAVQKSTAGYNPSTDISGNTDTSISTVNQQNLLKYTKGILDGYANLTTLLKTDVTTRFLNRFKNLFVSVIDYDDIAEDE